MQNTVHFSFSDLPPRYREQVRAKLHGEGRVGGKGVCGEGRINLSPSTPPAEPSKTTPNPKSKSNPNNPIRLKSRSSKSGVPNSTEEKFNREILLGKGKFEAVTFHLDGGSYTPDYYFVDPESKEIFFWEVKGSYRLPTHGRAAFAFKSASRAFPNFFFGWAELDKNRRDWKIVVSKNGIEYDSFHGSPKEFHEL